MDRLIIKVQREPGSRHIPYVVAEEIAVVYPMIYRDSGRRIGGVFPELESTGRRNRKRFEIAVRRGTTARGVETTRSRDRADAEATGAGVKKVCRRLRPQEAEKLAVADKEIEKRESDLKEARDRRADIVREAFAKGHVVRLSEMQNLASRHDSGDGSGGLR
jgi:hypothetical protein